MDEWNAKDAEQGYDWGSFQQAHSYQCPMCEQSTTRDTVRLPSGKDICISCTEAVLSVYHKLVPINIKDTPME